MIKFDSIKRWDLWSGALYDILNKILVFFDRQNFFLYNEEDIGVLFVYKFYLQCVSSHSKIYLHFFII